jgi:hypothetical protein
MVGVWAKAAGASTERRSNAAAAETRMRGERDFKFTDNLGVDCGVMAGSPVALLMPRAGFEGCSDAETRQTNITDWRDGMTGWAWAGDGGRHASALWRDEASAMVLR